MGASNHINEERQQHDYYATDPIAAEILLAVETFNSNIWEIACGEGHLSKVIEDYGYRVKSTDLIDRGYGQGGVDFLKETRSWEGDIITNPPYRLAVEFIEHSLKLIPKGFKVAMFLKLQFLEGQKRKKFFAKHPPKTIYVPSSGIKCVKNGDFNAIRNSASAIAYGWFIWEKGYTGDPAVKWVN